ncbi:hypothetical protein OVA03_07190 [Asticcacaulis sp. SL142]|uniref:hypothetical protein n=1 Tax=Asticcacaulis sp. SL142 TaxID=2995155 RepID=UPI00226D3F9E|nr:hypothetical protein [Asticcacaulis sp. SL142]WAC50020.1 hypothetical protein OVA03_07190 [Asticcacaulis sp. SL142]
MVDQGGYKNTKDNRRGFLIPRGQNQRQQLRLVTNFAEGDEGGGVEEGIHRLGSQS